MIATAFEKRNDGCSRIVSWICNVQMKLRKHTLILIRNDIFRNRSR
jgi:hypothetical protein